MIGVFDSGHGGLTVLRALVAAAPGRPFVYLGDHAAAPYGPRSEEDIYRLTVQGVERLFAQGCGLVVLACNTAAAVALRRIGKGAVPALLSGVRAVSAEMRGRCATLLGKIAPDDAHVAAVLQQVVTDEDEEVLRRIGQSRVPAFAILNKIDKVAPKEALLEHIAGMAQRHSYAEIVPVSAVKGDNLDQLLKLIPQHLPVSPPLFPGTMSSDRGDEFRGR